MPARIASARGRRAARYGPPGSGKSAPAKADAAREASPQALAEADAPINILGIDPGLTATGYGCLHCEGESLEAVDFGVIRPPASQPMPERLRVIGDGLREVFERFKPSHCAVEDIFVMHYARTALSLAQARGVCLLVAGENGCPVSVYASRLIKEAVCGYGGADKAQIVYMVRHLLKMRKAVATDAADALAAAICHANTFRLRQRIGG